jgi:hypothetical protein
MSKTHLNRLSRAEKALGLIEDGGDESDDPAAEARGGKALIRLKETRHADRPMIADELASMDARLAAMPRIRLNEAGQRALQALRAQRDYGGSQVPVLPAGHAGWPSKGLAS